MVSRDDFEHSSVGAGLVGSPGHGAAGYRGLRDREPEVRGRAIKATFAAEIGRTNGPFDNPEGWDRYKLFNKLTFAPTRRSALTLSEMSYAGELVRLGPDPGARRRSRARSRASDRSIPTRAATPRATSSALQYTPAADGEQRARRRSRYAGLYRFNLFSNFTLFLRDPDNGDEIEQVDRRIFYGGRVAYRVVHQLGAVRVRHDHRRRRAQRRHPRAALEHAAPREPLATVRDNDVHETFDGRVRQRGDRAAALAARSTWAAAPT